MGTRRSRSIVVGVVVVAVLGACGRNQPPSNATSVHADRVAAERVVLHTADLAGYDADVGQEPDPGSVHAASTFEACAGTAAALGDDSRIAQSPGFFKGRTIVVSSLAVVATNEGEARRAMSDLSRADLGGCLTALFRAVLSLDLLPGTSATTELVPSAAGLAGVQTTTWRTTIQVTGTSAAGAQTVSAYSDLTFFRSGRTVVSLFNFQVGEPFPAAERTRLLAAMAGRV